MTVRTWLAACVIAAVSGTAALAQARPVPTSERRPPNIILIITDDQGYGDAGFGGNPVVRTPNLDTLHGESVRLTDFHVDPTCSPTRAALMTGQHSLRAGVWHTVMGRSLLATQKDTLPERLGRVGYVSGIFGKWHLGDNYPFRPQDQGFDRAVIHGGGGVGQIPDHWGNTQFDDTYFVDGRPVRFEGYATHVWFDQAEAFIRENRDRPFFAYIATNAPHQPWRAPREAVQPYLDQGLPRQVAEFYGMVTDLDDQIGELRTVLSDTGLERDTILIFMTDNGSALMARDAIFDGDYEGFMVQARQNPQWQDWTYNAGLRGYKNEVYDGGHRVPFLIHWPDGGLDTGRDVEGLAAHFDVLPTLFDLIDAPLEGAQDLDGVSLVPALRGQERIAERTLVVTNQRVDIPSLNRPHVVMTERWRLVVNGARGTRELYDMDADAGQKTDLAAREPLVVSQLSDALQSWWDRIAETGETRQRIVIGAAEENPSRLTAMDWMEAGSERDVPWFPGFQLPVPEPASTAWINREADFKPLPWYLTAQSAGTYRFRAYLHDRPAARPVGRAFAFLEVDGRVLQMALPGLASWAEFEVQLQAGDQSIRAWFAADAEGQDQVLPAFFLYAYREDTPAQESSR